MLDTILKYWVEWICAGITAGIVWLGRKLWNRQKKAEMRQLAVEEGMQALLRDRIVQAYYHYAEKGWVTLHGLESVNVMYEKYHNLGGNGTVTKLVQDLRKLEVRDD